MFLIAAQFYAMLFNHNPTSMYIKCKRGAKGNIASFLGEGSMSRPLFWGVPNILEILVIGQSM